MPPHFSQAGNPFATTSLSTRPAARASMAGRSEGYSLRVFGFGGIRVFDVFGLRGFVGLGSEILGV